MGIFGPPGSHTRAAVSLAATSSGAFTPLRDARTDRGQRSHRQRGAGPRNRVSAPWHLTNTHAAHLTTQAGRDRH